MSSNTSLDQEIDAWYKSQSQETLCYLRDRCDAHTPRQAWKAFFNDCAFDPDCPRPAHKRPGDSLAAPAEAGQGVSIQQKQCYRNEYLHKGEWRLCGWSSKPGFKSDQFYSAESWRYRLYDDINGQPLGEYFEVSA